MTNRGPLITLGSVVLLGGILLATNQAIAKPEGPAPAHPVAAARPSAPLHALFEGRNSGNEETVAIEVNGSKADALLNANRSGAVTLRGSVTGSRIVLSGPSGAAVRPVLDRPPAPILGPDRDPAHGPGGGALHLRPGVPDLLDSLAHTFGARLLLLRRVRGQDAEPHLARLDATMGSSGTRRYRLPRADRRVADLVPVALHERGMALLTIRVRLPIAKGEAPCSI
jgi:hypothetical protein